MRRETLVILSYDDLEMNDLPYRPVRVIEITITLPLAEKGFGGFKRAYPKSELKIQLHQPGLVFQFLNFLDSLADCFRLFQA
jgi:hypothetical protein